MYVRILPFLEEKGRVYIWNISSNFAIFLLIIPKSMSKEANYILDKKANKLVNGMNLFS